VSRLPLADTVVLTVCCPSPFTWRDAFFFAGSGARGGLHSFPTRRSSDLAAGSDTLTVTLADDPPGSATATATGTATVSPNTLSGERKSTRLNASHPVSSYAVVG